MTPPANTRQSVTESETPPLPLEANNPKGGPMTHVFASLIYAVVVVLALLAYCVVTEAPLLILLLFTPFIVTAVVLFVMALDLAAMAVRWAWGRYSSAS